MTHTMHPLLAQVALDAKKDVEPDDSAPETDDGEMSDAFPSLEHGTEDAGLVVMIAKVTEPPR